MEDDETNISLAMQLLQSGVSKLIHKNCPPGSEKECRQQAKHLVEHVRHVLLNLTKRRRSLVALLEFSREEWKRWEKELATSPDRTVTILGHVFVLLVRCQDGLMLLTSGECRHQEDVKEASRTKYPSKLSTLKERNDGYTSLYKSDAVYSGYGWDEYANESVGIQRRLVLLFQEYFGTRKNLWESYLERHEKTSLLEALLDRHERGMKDIQNDLQYFKETLKNDIKKRMDPIQLSFFTQDKNEKLFIRTIRQEIRLERRANQFQLHGSGVLPKEYQYMRVWSKHCALKLDPVSHVAKIDHLAHTGSAPKRKRLIIEDTDDESCVENADCVSTRTSTTSPGTKTSLPTANQNLPTARTSGLVVRVESIEAKEAATDASLKAIKTGLGFNAEGMQASLDDFVQESTQLSMSVEERNVQKSRSVLLRAQRRTPVDHQEVWDARDCLRLAYVHLGIDLLYERHQFSKAVEFFEKAKEEASIQLAYHSLVSQSDPNVTPFLKRLVYRDTLLRSAEATVNVGIALIERSEHENSSKLDAKRGIQEFEKVKRLTGDVCNSAYQETQPAGSDEWAQNLAQEIDARKLECMASRYKGVSLWSFNEQYAIESLTFAGSIFMGFIDVQCQFDSLLLMALELAEECIHATTQLKDLALLSIEQLHRKDAAKGENLIATIEKALVRKCEILKEIEGLEEHERFSGTVKAFKVDREELGTVSDTFQYMEEIKTWWAKQYKTRKTDVVPPSPPPPTRQPRADLFAQAKVARNRDIATSFILLTEGRRRTSNRNGTAMTRQRALGEGAIPALNAVHMYNKQEELVPKSIEFRKWGEDLIPQASINSPRTPSETRPALPYPMSAPPMAPEVAAWFAASSQ